MPFAGNSFASLYFCFILKNIHKVSKLTSLKLHWLRSIIFPVWRSYSSLGLDYGLPWEEYISSAICISWPHSPYPLPVAFHHNPSPSVAYFPSRASHCWWPMSHVSSSHFICLLPPTPGSTLVPWNQGRLWLQHCRAFCQRVNFSHSPVQHVPCRSAWNHYIL